MTSVEANLRMYKRFSLKNALIGFPEEEKHWGKIINISKGGFKILSVIDTDFGKGKVLNVVIDFRSVPDQALKPNHFELKIKIVWKYQDSKIKGPNSSYGACFADLGAKEKEMLHSLFESIDRSKKISDDDIDNVLKEIDLYLEQFRTSK